MNNDEPYEWNEIKRQSNLEKHGQDFADVRLLQWNLAICTTQIVKGETRILSYVPLNNRLFAVVHTERGVKRRIISFRKANSREMDYYERETD